MVFEFVLQHIKKNKKARKIYTIVFFIVLILLVNYAGINAIREVMTRSASEVVTGDILICNPDYNFSLIVSDTESPRFVDNTDREVERISQNTNVTKVLKRINSSALMAVNEYTYDYINLIGIDTNAETFDILEGTNIERENQILITRSISEEFELSVGDEVTLSVSNAIPTESNIKCVISGIYDNDRFGFMRSNHIIIELSDLQRILGKEDEVTHLMVYTYSGTETDVLEEIKAGNTSLKYLTSEEAGDLIYSIQDGMSYVMIALVVIMMIIAMVIVANLSLSYLKKQEKEIAVLCALGMKKRQILAIYVLEAFLQSVVLAGGAVLICSIAVAIAGNIGIPIAGGQKLFGDTELILSLKAGQIFISCAVIIFSSVLSSLISLFVTLRRISIAILE